MPSSRRVPALTFTAAALVPRVAAQVFLKGLRASRWRAIRAQIIFTTCQARSTHRDIATGSLLESDNEAVSLGYPAYQYTGLYFSQH